MFNLGVMFTQNKCDVSPKIKHLTNDGNFFLVQSLRLGLKSKKPVSPSRPKGPGVRSTVTTRSYQDRRRSGQVPGVGGGVSKSTD